jgi:hypothetical protein
MSSQSAVLLMIAVLVVGVLHTLVPDHWVPITLIARQRGWSRAQTGKAAALAGLGHTISTLLIAAVLWVAGMAFAARFGEAVDRVASLALIGFGAWVAIGSLRELDAESHHQGEALAKHGHAAHHGHHHELGRQGHAHVHRHEGGPTHIHWHTHGHGDWHGTEGDLALSPPLHDHAHPTSGRTALLLVLGSSPMVEGIPAFFAASRFGVGLILVMSVVFALATMSTYVALCLASTAGLQRMHLGPLERYGEVISGSFIALLGVVFLFIH